MMLAAMVAAITPITTGARARRPHVTRIPTAMPEAGQKTATPSVSKASPSRAARKYAIATPIVEPSASNRIRAACEEGRYLLAPRGGRVRVNAPPDARSASFGRGWSSGCRVGARLSSSPRHAVTRATRPPYFGAVNSIFALWLLQLSRGLNSAFERPQRPSSDWVIFVRIPSMTTRGSQVADVTAPRRSPIRRGRPGPRWPGGPRGPRLPGGARCPRWPRAPSGS